MKIRSRLTLRYVCVTAAVFSLFVLGAYWFSESTREKEFFRDLTREAVTKANLFLSGSVDAETMQSIYRNNMEFIDEVEVAVYTTDFMLLYHDAQDIDIIKETPDLIASAIREKEIEFYEGRYQGIAMLYDYQSAEYVITAAAYDGYGYAKRNSLTSLLVILWLLGLVILAVVGYLLARGALRPVSRIVDEVDAITESNLDSRLKVKNEKDELGELSETFNRMLDRLETSFNNHKMFVGNVAHELRTPLSALIAELEVARLRDKRTEEEYKVVIDRTHDDALKLKSLIAGLLDLARAGYDSSQIAMEELRLDELLLDSRDTVLNSHRDYSVELIFDQDNDEDKMLTVKGNEYLLKMAFSNLIENNCKFSEEKTSYVHISFYGDNSIVRFSDTGIGISNEEIEKLFTPFYRGENSGYAAGQGIGMALARKVIDLHKGIIKVNSHIGEGTVFTVEIPHV